MSPVYNNTITLSNTVGELNKTVTVSSTNPQVTGEDLLQLAKRALEHNEVTGVEGVSVEINVTGHQECGVFTMPMKVVAVDVGYSPAAAAREQRELLEARKFSDELEHRTSELFESALEWYLCKSMLVSRTEEGWAHVQKMGAREIAKGWAHVQMLQEHIERLEKNHAEGQEIINNYSRQINELQQLMGKRAEDYEAQIRELQGTAVATNRAAAKELKDLRDALDKSNTRGDELVSRLNVVRAHIDSIEKVI